MKWTALFTSVFIGLVVGDGAWKANREYNYTLEARTFIELPKSNNQWVGVVSRARLSIHPQSDNLLIGQITQAEYAEVDQKLTEVWDSNFNDRELAYRQWPLNKPFKIHLKNGVIHSLSVDRTITNDQMNQLKVVASRFQVDTNAENRIENKNNEFPVEGSNNAMYKAMEPTVTGDCETNYDIFPLPEYLAQSHRDWVPLPELKGEGEFIQIVKTRNDKNCNERIGFYFGITGHSGLKHTREQNLKENREQNSEQNQDQNREQNSEQSREQSSEQSSAQSSEQSSEENRDQTTQQNVEQYTNQMDNDASHSEVSRIIISGSLKSHTIQSSVTINKVVGSPALYDYVNVTLESVEQSASHLPMRFGNMVNIGNLVYTYSLPSVSDSQYCASPMRLTSELPKSDSVGEVSEELWSSCWTWFPAGSTICKSQFGPEYEEVTRKTCGFLGLGMMINCRFSFPGCEATPCFSVFIARSELCNRTFGTNFPVTKGGFEDCSPGFYRSRCCPKLYE